MQLMVEGGEFPRIKSFNPVPAQHTAWSGAGVDSEEKPPIVASKERSYTIIFRKGFLARKTSFPTALIQAPGQGGEGIGFHLDHLHLVFPLT